MLLCIDQRVVVHVVELHFAVSECTCCTQQCDDAVFTFWCIQQSCHQLEVVYHTNVHVVVGQFCYRLDDRCRTIEVSTLRRADTVG